MEVQFRPLDGVIGAEILNVDITRPMDVDTYSQVRRIWLDHCIVLFRDQDLDPDQLVAFGRQWGEIEMHTLSAYHMPGRPEVFVNSNIVKGDKPIGAQKSGRFWHSDSQFIEIPSSATILHAKQVPSKEGDTQYANMYLAYEALSEETRRRITGLRGVYSRVKSWTVAYTNRKPMSEEEKARFPDVEHPIVRTHPETQRKALYIGSLTELKEIVGLPREEGDTLAKQLYDFATQERFVYSHRWNIGDTIVWDNRCTIHRALPFDEQKYDRLMHRVTIQGDAPFL